MNVLDASAVLAFLRDEPGADLVEDALATGVVPAPNWSEVVQKVRRASVEADRVMAQLLAVGIEVEPLLRVDAELAADIWSACPELSLADRCCLAVAARLEVPVLTADTAWGVVRSRLDASIDVRPIR